MKRGLERGQAVLLIVDVQEKLFALVERPCEVMHALQKLARAFQVLNEPILLTEQYPEGLGGTVSGLKELLSTVPTFSKTSFSCLGNREFKEAVQKLNRKQWVVAGIESHVCILQTVRDLLSLGLEVVVANDAISSRSIYDFSTAIAELRDMGARISSTETILFELVKDSKIPEFKEISKLIK